MKKFFNSMEERFVFPIGRKTWQILALFSLLGLALSFIYFLLNSTPTSRDSVSVSKNEVINKKIDTTIVVEIDPNKCTLIDYQKWLDSLKSDLPKAEWTKLGDSSEPHSSYLLDEYGNYKLDSVSGDNIIIQVKDFIPNPTAIPNLLEKIYLNKGYDSSSYCDKIEVIKLLHKLNENTAADFLTEQGFNIYVEIVSNTSSLSLSTINRSFELAKIIETNDIKIKNEADLKNYFKYLKYFIDNSISDEQIELVKSVINSHKSLSNTKFKKSDYFELAEIIFESKILTNELKVAIKEFNEDISFYDSKDLSNSLKRYLKLYKEKLDRAEEVQALKKASKAVKRGQSLIVAGITFASIVSIATILLLFSIQSLLKRHISKQED
jgi:hypothetical protein